MSISYDLHAQKMRARAERGLFRGGRSISDASYLRSCRRIISGTTLIFTRDVGHHSNGWWKNPDYERCWHLSMSPAPSALWTPDTPDLDRPVRDAWLRAFFRDDLPKIWAEPPFSHQGKTRGVWHYRLFADPTWAPIVPRGEVYGRELTEAGWKSFSELSYAGQVEEGP